MKREFRWFIQFAIVVSYIIMWRLGFMLLGMPETGRVGFFMCVPITTLLLLSIYFSEKETEVRK